MRRGVDVTDLSLSGAGAAFGSLVVATVRRNPVRVGVSVTAYVSGMLLLFLFAGLTPSAEQVEAFEAALPEQRELQAAREARMDVDRKHTAYRSLQGWFWSCGAECQAARTEWEAAKLVHEGKARVVDAKQREANSHLGLLSTSAVGQAKDLFWSTVGGGGEFVKRQTWWDLMSTLFFRGIRFSSMRSWDEEGSNFLSIVIDMIGRVVINVWLAVTGVVVTFSVSVWSVISSYNPNPLTAAVFFLGALLAALSFAFTVCAGCCGCAMGAVAAPVYIAARAARANGRIGYGGGDVDGRGERLEWDPRTRSWKVRGRME
jgi:hypothetical protein